MPSVTSRKCCAAKRKSSRNDLSSCSDSSKDSNRVNSKPTTNKGSRDRKDNRVRKASKDNRANQGNLARVVKAASRVVNKPASRTLRGASGKLRGKVNSVVRSSSPRALPIWFQG